MDKDTLIFTLILFGLTAFLCYQQGVQAGIQKGKKLLKAPAGVIDDIHYRVTDLCENWPALSNDNRSYEMDCLISLLESWIVIFVDRKHENKKMLRTPKKDMDTIHIQKLIQEADNVINLCKMSLEIFKAPEIGVLDDLSDQLQDFQELVAEIRNKQSS